MSETTLTAEHMDILRHSLGLTKRETKPYRNYFCTGPGTVDWPTCNELVSAGYMRASHTINEGRDTIFVVTDEGRAALRSARGED